METQTPLTRRERKELKRKERKEANEAMIEKRQTGRFVRWVAWSVLGIVIIGGIVWLIMTTPKTPESEIVSRNGLHWHPEIEIYVKGEKQEAPSNLGVGASYMAPVHTHEADGVIHLEFSGLVLKRDTTLGQFFKIWGKDINSFGTNIKMTVNGIENTELGNYQMQDGDKIELRFD